MPHYTDIFCFFFQDPLYFLPTAEVVTDFDIGTLPWVYLRHGAVYTITPAQFIDEEEQDEAAALIDMLTAQAGVSSLAFVSQILT